MHIPVSEEDKEPSYSKHGRNASHYEAITSTPYPADIQQTLNSWDGNMLHTMKQRGNTMAKTNSTKQTAVTEEQSIAKRDATITNMEQLLTINISDILKAGQAGVTAYIDLGNTINKALHELKPWGYKTVKSIRELFELDRSKADRALRFANNFELLTTAEGINEAERIIKDSKGPREQTEAEKIAQTELDEVSQPMEGETEDQTMERVADWKRVKRIMADVTKIKDLTLYGPKLVQDMVQALEENGIMLDENLKMKLTA